MNAELIATIEAGIMARKGRVQGEAIWFLCPDHADAHATNCSWDARALVWHCFACGAGGGAFDLAKRLGIDLPVSDEHGLTVVELADYAGLPPAFLRSVGVADGVSGIKRTPCVDIPYTDSRGELAAVRKRLRLKGEPRMIWRRGDHVSAYGLSRLEDARARGSVVIVEGETDAWTLWRNDIPALGLPGAATWKESWRPHLDGIETVYLWREADQGGDTLTAAIRLDVPNVQIISAPVGLKDPSALWHACGHDADEFRSRFSALLDAARPASQLREEQLSTEAREVYRRAAPLLESPDLLDKVEAAIREGGYAGDTRPPMLAYLAITSRHLDRPLNLHFLSPSGGGKNRSVDGGSELHPPEAFHLEKAGSARALIYTAEDLRNRVVIVAEADSLPQEDGSAASAIRSLAEDGFMTYDVVEKDPQSGEFRTRRIRKDGPTGLITTGTKPLGEQLSTRCLTVTVSDTPAQTLAVTRAHAAAVNGERPGRDVSVFIDAQRWIELAGDHEVTVPFGHHLAELVPHDHVRMRRDFRQLLTAIQAVGLLFQRQRERDARGRIVATLEDYAHARRYLLDAFTTAATDGVTPQVRETVEAVIAIQKTELQASSIKALAGALGLTPQATRKRAWSAVALGYLHNTADRGQPLSLIPGDPLPTARPALPAVADLSTHVCGVVPETEFPGFPAAESDSEPGSSRETEDICPPIPAFAEVTPETEKARGKRPAFPIMTAARVDSESERTHQEAAGNRETGNRGDQHTCMDCGGPVDPDVQRCNLCVADILDRLDQ